MSQSNCSAAPDECRYAAHMTDILSLYTLDLLLLIAVTAVIAGMVKGIVGFAMPMIFITGMTIFVAPDLALGILILPTLVTNGWQAGRQGFSAALKSLYDHRLSFACAVIAGIGGGISGVWGPPTVMYLSTHQLEKQAQMRAQGVIYGLGAVLLLFGHLGSGIATPQALSLGGFAIVPACFGIWIGFQIQDRINQNMFRITTSSVLILAGLNLIRRGVM